jgi:hypothetical protein
MKIIDLSNPSRVRKKPDHSVTVFSSKDFTYGRFIVKKVELRLYVEKVDKKLGPYSLITTLVETDMGSIEMKYDEGFRGQNPLETTKEFLVSTLGLSGLISRSVIALDEEMAKEPT